MAAINVTAQTKYLQQQIDSASAIGRVVILYDACIRFMNDATEAFQVKDKVLGCEKIIRAQNIIRELRNALNLDLDPKIGGNLYRLYTFFLKQLSEANRTRSTDPIAFVIQQMSSLNESWKQADTQGLGRDIKRYEERLGVEDVNIVKRYRGSQAMEVMADQKTGVLQTLNVRV